MINPQVSGDVTLYSVENVRYLGVKVSSDLSWSKHVSGGYHGYQSSK